MTGGQKNVQPDTVTGAGQAGDEAADPMGRAVKDVRMGQGEGEGAGINAGAGGEKPETGGVRPDKQPPGKS